MTATMRGKNSENIKLPNISDAHSATNNEIQH